VPEKVGHLGSFRNLINVGGIEVPSQVNYFNTSFYFKF